MFEFAASWWSSVGLLAPLSLVSIIFLPGRHGKTWYLSFFSVLAACSVFRFQPWKYDNLKMIYICVFGIAGGVALLLEQLRSYDICAALLPYFPAPANSAVATAPDPVT